MDFCERFSEGYELLAVEHADSLTAGAHALGPVTAGDHDRFVLVIDVGEMAQGATLDAVIRECTNAAGSNMADIVGKAITQLTQAGGDGNEVVLIELRGEELTPGYDFISPLITVANDAVEYSATLWGFVAGYEPVATTLISEIVD